MKINVVKFIVALIIAAVVGVICYSMTVETDNRQWISFGVTTATVGLMLAMAIGIDYNCGKRNMNIKLLAWLNLFAVIVCNIVFNCFLYPILIYVAVSVLLAVLGFLQVYVSASSKKDESSSVQSNMKL